MDRVRSVNRLTEALHPYNASTPAADIRLHANENSENLPSEIVTRLVNEFPQFRFNRYPDPTATKLRERIAEANGLDPENIVIGNGGDELIFNMFLAWGGPGRTYLDMPPTFEVYALDAHITGTTIARVPRTASFDVDEQAVLDRVSQGDIDIVVVANPNNPTGNLTDESFLSRLLEATDALVMVDEAYFEFSRQTMRPHMMRHKNLVILRTFSKAFSMAGLRIGYVLAHEEVAAEFMRVRQPYSVNAISQWVASNVYRDRAALEQNVRDIIRNRDQIITGLSRFDEVEVFPSEANYVLFRIDEADEVWHNLLDEHSILIRNVSKAPLLEGCLRVTVGSSAENLAFLTAMERIIADRRKADIAAALGEGE